MRNFSDIDLIMPRIVWLESQGLPMTAQLEKNLKGYTQHLGEWVSWSYEKDEGRAFFNPLICISTTCYDTIMESMRVLVKGKLYDIKFLEVTNKENLIGSYYLCKLRKV